MSPRILIPVVLASMTIGKMFSEVVFRFSLRPIIWKVVKVS